MTEDKRSTKTDCFGFYKGECKILYELVCANKTCSFYKTTQQFQADKKKYSYKGR